ncbi:hypothetical protein CMT25_11425 [Elizabethkingia anophelis]|uniref:hypothetical protein n=1 Tax=Elizabethkingia anophelis TaxID=1117645 RepID=UPI000999D998|nr:hypothetical protein [Elizabethkingia anophelis]MDV4130752.1 hypothetical protein [Elizabethkingia anophelis]MDV4132535.1 hypothetical protein [Elizabethkingia anophelis]OPC57890.1 hypothetical protein BAY08_03635 [Elizabethkingia anophelis]
METPKEQAIKAAYGEHWIELSNEKQKYALENEGWIKVTPYQYQMDMFSRLKLNKNTHSVRPKCLTGIRNNNSWTRIESEEDLPKEECKLFVHPPYQDQFIFHYHNNEGSRKELIQNHTHYQPIEVPKSPVF